MLYVTTADKNDVYTAHNALCKECSKDGGQFIPYRLPVVSEEYIKSLPQQSFGARIAHILNIFFSAKYTGTDIDFCVGKRPARIAPAGHRIWVGELWHNHENMFETTAKKISRMLVSPNESSARISSWSKIVVKIALLWGLFGDLVSTGVVETGNKVDISAAAGDLSTAMAAWYAREMGLPIGTIVIGCEESSDLWDLMYQGEMRIHKNAGFLGNLERMICETCGFDEASAFRMACAKGCRYVPGKVVLNKLGQGIFAAVVSGKRAELAIPNLYRTNSMLMDLSTAFAYCGMMDYRAKNKETAAALLLRDNGPVTATDEISRALGISEDALKHILRFG